MKTFLLTLAAALAALLLLLAALIFSEAGQGWALRRGLAFADLGATQVEFERVKIGKSGLRLHGLHVVHEGAVLELPSLDLELSSWGDLRAKRVNVMRLIAHGWTLDLRSVEPESRRRMLMVLREASTRADAAGEVVLPRSFALLPSAYAQEGAAAAELVWREAFDGLLSQVELPMDLAVDGLELEGRMIFPKGIYEENPEIALSFELKGEGLGAGLEGQLSLHARTELVDEPGAGASAAPEDLDFNATLSAELLAQMESPRRFSALSLTLDLTAAGGLLPEPLQLSGAAAVRRAASGEDYTLSLGLAEKQVAALQARYNAGAAAGGDAVGEFAGHWKLAIATEDLPRWLLEKEVLGELSLPVFDLQGQGSFGLDALFSTLSTAGRLQARLAGLTALVPSLPDELGALNIDAEFDGRANGLGAADGAWEAHLASLRLKAAVPDAPEPLFLAEAAQPLTLTQDAATDEPAALQSANTGSAAVATGLRLTAENPQAALARVEIPGLPLALLEPFVEGLGFRESLLRGRFEATLPSEYELLVCTQGPLRVEQLGLDLEGEAALRDLDLALEAKLEHNLATARTELQVSELYLRSGARELLTVELELGHDAAGGPSWPQEAERGGLAALGRIVAATRVQADLGALREQPLLAQDLPLETGKLGLYLTAETAQEGVQRLTALLETSSLTAQGIALPNLNAKLEAEHDGAGMITLELPLTVRSAQRPERESDLSLAGSARLGSELAAALGAKPVAAGLPGQPAAAGGDVAAKIHGGKLYLDDFQFLVALASNSDADETPTTPFINNWSGEIGLELDSVSYLGQLELRQVGAKLKIGDGKLRFEDLKIGSRGSTAGLLRGIQDSLTGGLLEALGGEPAKAPGETQAAQENAEDGDGAPPPPAAQEVPDLLKKPLDKINEGLRRLRKR